MICRNHCPFRPSHLALYSVLSIRTFRTTLTCTISSPGPKSLPDHKRQEAYTCDQRRNQQAPRRSQLLAKLVCVALCSHLTRPSLDIVLNSRVNKDYQRTHEVKRSHKDQRIKEDCLLPALFRSAACAQQNSAMASGLTESA